MAGGKGLANMSDIPRAQLIHIDVDRRLGHEWDEWDGKPLPNLGDYDSAPSLFFRWSAAAIAVLFGTAALAVYLLGPRLALVAGPIPQILWLALGGLAAATWLWWGLLLLSFVLHRPL